MAEDIKTFIAGGMDLDSAYELVAKNDYLASYNIRNNGTTGEEVGYITDPESTALIPGSRAAGINKGIGGKSFEDVHQIVTFIYNSAGFHQISVFNSDTQSQQVIYTDKTDSNGLQLLNLDPQYYVNCILVNETYLLWVDGKNEVGYTNLKTLTSGAYGTVLAEDLSLLKPQLLIPLTGVYSKDSGKASNFVKGKLFQFIAQYINADFNYSTWSTWSKRIIPPQESTPLVGTDVSENNCIIVTVNIGSIRAQQLNIACRYSLFDYGIIKSVDRSYIVSLPNTAVNIDNAIYEAYDPALNTYSFVFYNESLFIPVPATETDQFVDYIWPATALEKINGNIIALGNLKVGYPRPITDVTIKAVGYDPNLSVPDDDATTPLKAVVTYAGGEGSGSNKYKRRMDINYTGVPHTNDVLNVTTYNTTNASDTKVYTPYVVPSGQDGDLLAVVNSFAATLEGGVFQQGDGYTIEFYGAPHFSIQSAPVNLYNAGAQVSKSIHAILDNSSYQLAISYRDKFGRPFPLVTNNDFIVTTPSFAQLNGLTPLVSWAVNNPAAPVGAVDFQWLITKNTTTTNILDVFGNILNYIGVWDAHTNAPALSASQAGAHVGDTYQIGAPNLPTDTPVNLGNGAQVYNTGDYVVYNGNSWDIVPKSFGDLTSSGDILAIKINPLNLFNQRYTNNGVNTILTYDFTDGDRCTLHYYVDPSTPTVKTFLNNPCIDVDVFGYDAATFLLKVQKSSAISTATLSNKDIFLRLYTPNSQQPSGDALAKDTTIWYEIGERYTITNGLHDTLSGNITDGDVYFKTRSYSGAVDPNIAYDVLATDFNFSDFYQSNFTSYGRPRQYNDVLEQTEQKATIITSQNYILGSKLNGLNRFYAENQYGEADGQTSSSYGGIYVLWQRGDMLETAQELRWGSIPVNRSILEDAAQQQQYAISEKLLGNIRYSQTASVGIGTAKESFCFKDNNAYFIDPHRSEPFRYGLDGIQPISGKLSKYFKATLQLAYAQGKKIVMYYNMFYDEVMLCIQAEGGVLTFFPFSEETWEPYEDFTIVAANVTGVSAGAHSTVVWDAPNGKATFTPTAGYVGNDSGTMVFSSPMGILVKNICLNWTAGNTTVNPFIFQPQVDVPLSTVISSNVVLITGMDIAVPISITGGEYSIDGGAFTSSPGTVVNTDNVQVRQTSSASNSTTTTATLTVGSYSTDFDVTTISSTPSQYQIVTAYGYTVTSIVDNTATGTPAGFASLSIPPNGSVSEPYTTIAAGTVNVVIAGTPAFINLTLRLTIDNVLIDTVPIPSAGTYQLTFPLTNNPQKIRVFIFR